LNQASARIAGMGIVTALGSGTAATLTSLKSGRAALAPVNRFPTPAHDPLPVGSVALENPTDESLPRAHYLARVAADQAMETRSAPPDAIVLGITTGGLDRTEEVLMTTMAPDTQLGYHCLTSVTEDLARRYHCCGPLLTISTACSSGAVAIKLALDMIRTGLARCVLAGGVDSICRLTYYGFKSLQLLDVQGARPLDQDRRGMSVAEGAALLRLEACTDANTGPGILGAGLSCDAYHPARPHPDGDGALAAMQAALVDAGRDKESIDYINLHGTGTTDNDLAEARAIRRLFGVQHPPLSSIKGALGHSLAAAGAVEAVIAAQSLTSGFLPGTTGCQVPDKELGVTPLMEPQQRPLETVLSNSFGFGGNNAALVFGQSLSSAKLPATPHVPLMRISGWSAFTGAGTLAATLKDFDQGRPCQGCGDVQAVAGDLSPAQIRRLKRLSVMALGLAHQAVGQSGDDAKPDGIFFGTGLGCLSETHDFLERLFATDERFAGPTDFVGSVHNAPAGQIALHFNATGPNITTSGGDYSFEQALFTAGLVNREASALVLAADEGHVTFSALFDPSVDREKPLSDGGGALWLTPISAGKGPTVALQFFQTNLRDREPPIDDLVDQLERHGPLQERYALIMAGMPAGCRPAAEQQLTAFWGQAGYNGPIVDYRSQIGEFQSASAVAAAIAAAYIHRGSLPPALSSGYKSRLDRRGILILGLGKWLTAMEVMPLDN